NEMLDFQCLIRQPSARAFAGSLIDVPSLRDQSEETLPVSKLHLDRVMGEIVQRKKRRLFIIDALPRHGSIVANAFQDGGAVSSFCELNGQGREDASRRERSK